MIARRKLDEFDFDALREQANRERAEAVYRLLLQPLANFFRHAPRPHRHPQGTHRRAAA
jgi:hypothetical protein